MNERNSCPACFADNVSHCFIKNGYDIWRCKECRTMFVHDVPDTGELTKIYASDNYYEMPIDSVRRIQKESQRRLMIIKNYKSRGTFFDIGCARGLLLDEARLVGFDTYGIELSHENVKICVDNNHHVIHGYLENILSSAPADGFDVITCLDVIEHVEDPISFLLTASSMLKEDGIMVVTTPNYSGIVASMLKNRDPYMTPPEHLNYFTFQGMYSLFKRSNLIVEKTLTFGHLVESELDRVVSKYAPAFLSPIEPIIKASIPFGMRALNAIKAGVEQEFYLSRTGK